MAFTQNELRQLPCSTKMTGCVFCYGCPFCRPTGCNHRQAKPASLPSHHLHSHVSKIDRHVIPQPRQQQRVRERRRALELPQSPLLVLPSIMQVNCRPNVRTWEEQYGDYHKPLHQQQQLLLLHTSLLPLQAAADSHSPLQFANCPSSLGPC